MKVSFLGLKLLALLVFVTLLAACNKDTNEESLDDTTLLSRTDDMTLSDYTYEFGDIEETPVDALDIEAIPPAQSNKCFKFVYPISIVFPDSSLVSVASREELIQTLKNWRHDNPSIKGRPHLVYPVTVTMKDGTQVTVNNRQEMLNIIKDCAYKIRLVKLLNCIEPVFPVTLVFPDGTSQSVNSKEEFKNVLKTWRENNPDAVGHPTLQFPFDVKLKNGEIVTINNLEELKTLVKKCIKRRWFIN